MLFLSIPSRHNGMIDVYKRQDMDKAVEYLREKGLAKAAKKAGRIAAEGVSYALVENGVGALVEAVSYTHLVKCSRVPVNMAAYQLLRRQTDYPLHLGVTEAGTPRMGVLKSAIGIGGLLCQGIGDTIRVSLTADPVEEAVSYTHLPVRGTGLGHGGAVGSAERGGYP